MKNMKLILVSVAGLIILQSNFLFAQTIDDSEEQANEYPKHSVDLRISILRNSESGVAVQTGGISINTGPGNMGGRIMYNYYPENNYAFTFSMGVLSSQVKVKTLSNYTSTIIPIMMGGKYFLIPGESGNALRPYFFASVGMVYGTESNVKILSVEDHTETALGAYFGFGTDMILGSLVKLHADLGYNIFEDFKEPVGNRNNYGGPEFSFGVGFMF